MKKTQVLQEFHSRFDVMSRHSVLITVAIDNIMSVAPRWLLLDKSFQNLRLETHYLRNFPFFTFFDIFLTNHPCMLIIFNNLSL